MRGTTRRAAGFIPGGSESIPANNSSVGGEQTPPLITIFVSNLPALNIYNDNYSLWGWFATGAGAGSGILSVEPLM